MMKTLKNQWRRHSHYYDVSITNFEHTQNINFMFNIMFLFPVYQLRANVPIYVNAFQHYAAKMEIFAKIVNS